MQIHMLKNYNFMQRKQLISMKDLEIRTLGVKKESNVLVLGRVYLQKYLVLVIRFYRIDICGI